MAKWNSAAIPDGETLIYGILGYPLGHSLSPLIHNSAFRYAKINAIYIPIEIPHVNSALKDALLNCNNFRGLSVTIPHKQWAYTVAEKKDVLTECCQAANTLLRTPQGKLSAINTDGPGALRALEDNLELRGKRILIIGYGGSATAIAHALLLEKKPQRLLITGRNVRKCNGFVTRLRKKHNKKRTEILSVKFSDLNSEDIDIIINTTPLGMKGKPQMLPIPQSLVTGRHTVFDIVYNPLHTPLLRLARSKGAKVIPGYLMLLYQAVLQFEKFTGKKAPEKLMKSKLMKALYR